MDLAVELHERRAQRRRIAVIEQIETVVHAIHAGERRRVGPAIERGGNGPGIAAAGARPVEQRLGADRLLVDVVGRRQKCKPGAVRSGRDARYPFLRGASAAAEGWSSGSDQHADPAGTVTIASMVGSAGSANTF